MSDILVKFSYGCKNILFALTTMNRALFIIKANFLKKWVYIGGMPGLSAGSAQEVRALSG